MSPFSIGALWRALSDAHDPPRAQSVTFGTSALPGQAMARPPGPSGLDDAWPFARSQVARVMRLRHALDDSLPLAFEQLQRMLGAISFAEVRQVLVALVRDIALVWCGSVILGGGLGGVIGAFGGGVGAIPGAALGASVGASAGEALLALFGLKALAESMTASMPRALRAYRQGARDAWDDPPFPDPRDGHDAFRTRQAAWELAQGHMALLQALLTALLAMLSRGGAARAMALHEIGANARLGPAVARWLEAQEAPLRQALSRAGRSSEADRARRPVSAPAVLVTPSRLRLEAEGERPAGSDAPNARRAQEGSNSLGPIVVTPRGVAVTDELRALQGTSPRVGDFADLRGASLEDVVARVPASWALVPQDRGAGIKFLEDQGFERIRIHGPSLAAPPGSNSASGWTMRVMDQSGNYYDDAGNVVTYRANDGHIPIQGNSVLGP